MLRKKILHQKKLKKKKKIIDISKSLTANNCYYYWLIRKKIHFTGFLQSEAHFTIEKKCAVE